jgi:hypothetical protein
VKQVPERHKDENGTEKPYFGDVLAPNALQKQITDSKTENHMTVDDRKRGNVR